MMYAATTAALRPALLNKFTTKNSQICARTRTRSGLTVDKNAPALIKLGLYERYRGDQMLEHVSFLHVV